MKFAKESDPLQAVQELVRKDNLTPNAATLAERLQIAGHVDDHAADGHRAQGNVEPLEFEDLDAFMKQCPRCERNNRHARDPRQREGSNF